LIVWKDFFDFYRFIKGRSNRTDIITTRSFSRPTLSIRFGQFLDHFPTALDIWELFPPTTRLSSTPWVYGCDGKWLRRVGVFFIHRNVTTQENLWWSFMQSESYEAIACDVKEIAIRLRISPMGVVSDWKGAIQAAVAAHFGPIPHQRCMAHVERQIKRLLPLNSPYQATQRLRHIALFLFSIETQQDLLIWKGMLARWEEKHRNMLKERTVVQKEERKSWWYTHGNLRRGWRLLTHDQSSLFVFLSYPLIPKTNNSLEGVNSNLKQKLGNHRGMVTMRQVSFLSWYLAFTRVQNDAGLKKLWGWWKKTYSPPKATVYIT